MANQDAIERLSNAFRTEVDEGTKERHIAEMSAAIRTAPQFRVPMGLGLRHRIAGVAAAAVVAIAPVGMAVAAENAVPGEILYPLKQVTERVRAFVDEDIAATHRVEEAERLVVRGAPIDEITRAVERAEDATAGLVEGRVLGTRLESVRERLRLQDEQERATTEREGSSSGQQDEADSGSDQVNPDNGQTGPGGGSATTSVPRSADQGSGGGEHSGAGESAATDEPQQQNGNTEAEGNPSGNGTADQDGSGSGGGTAPPTSVGRQGSDAPNGSER